MGRNGEWRPDAELESLSHAVIGAAIDVHRELGPGFVEEVYEKALAIELALRDIPFVRQHRVPLLYKGQVVGSGKIDFFVQNRLIVELKAVDALSNVHTAQVLKYLRVTGQNLGLLINFHVALLKNGVERVILDPF